MATELALRFIDNDGSLGHVRGGVLLDGDKIVEYGVYGALARRIVGNVARLARVDEPRAIELIAAEPYGNQGMTLGPSSPLARKTHERTARLVDHLPGQHDQDDHAGGKLGAAVAKLKKALESLGGEVGGKYFDDREGVEPGRYLDASFGADDTREYMSIETGYRDEETREGEVAQITLHRDEARAMASAMATSLLARESAPDGDDPRSVLLSSLMLAGESGGFHPGDPRSDEPHSETNRNFDWNLRDGEWMFEAYSDDTEATAFSLNDDEFRALHASIVMTLLEDERQRNE